MWYGYLADLVAAVHLAYVAYVVVGQALIVVAAPFRWEWARNPWFRFTHLLAIGIVVYEAAYNIPCPLTVWEHQLRAAGGQEFAASDTFVGRLLHSVLFFPNMPPVFFTTLYVATFVVVAQGLVMYPPRWWRWKRQPQARLSVGLPG